MPAPGDKAAHYAEVGKRALAAFAAPPAQRDDAFRDFIAYVMEEVDPYASEETKSRIYDGIHSALTIAAAAVDAAAQRGVKRAMFVEGARRALERAGSGP
jgi:enoyl-CoA hydratase/carnithine racemase